MTSHLHVLVAASIAGGLACAANAALVQVTIEGVVEYNQFQSGPLAGQGAGSAVEISFLLDSASFVNDPSFPTRGYVIDQASYVYRVGAATLGLQSPFPAASTPYFVLRNNDPAVDGFFIATDTAFPTGVPLSANGGFGALRDQFSVTYLGSTIPSLDILDAVGTYDFTGLTNFNFTISDGPFDPLGVVFSQMTIEVVPSPAALALLTPLAFARRRRRR
ncbi:MAG TPA: hypothetical protein PKC43_01410 [Phycisphaerales bacterium]|nr:hypothetical protein [Phycisphaerales bacterium]HMP36083.1 hypothetical protein [Phycisphaerales bacterium]